MRVIISHNTNTKKLPESMKKFEKEAPENLKIFVFCKLVYC